MPLDHEQGAVTMRGRHRWIVCGLLFGATTLSYMDRQILGLLKPSFMHDLHWSETEFGDIVATFSLAYAFGYLLAGRLVDRIGVKLGLMSAVTIWSLASAAHAVVGSVTGFKLVRGALGLAEGANFPAAVKSVRQWFTPDQRALAIGIFNSGSNVAAIVTPVALPVVVHFLGWRAAFIGAGLLGLVWSVAWALLYKNPAFAAELSPAPATPPQRDGWLQALRWPGTWAFAIGMLLTSPVWWFYLNWMPGYVSGRFGTSLSGTALPIVVIYLVADVGSIAGGALSSFLVRRGGDVVRSRVLALALMALCALPVAFVSQVQSLWPAVAIIALAAAGHQGFAANLYACASDLVPFEGLSSVIGIGGFFAGIAGMFAAMGTGRILDATHGNYLVLFIIAALAYPVAALAAHFILRGQTARDTRSQHAR